MDKQPKKTAERTATKKTRATATTIRGKLKHMLSFLAEQYIELLEADHEYDMAMAHQHVSFLTAEWACDEAGLSRAETLAIRKKVDEATEAWTNRRKR